MGALPAGRSIVAETSHFGEGRPQWLNEVASEVERVRGAGVPVQGICLYPLVDRPDWSNFDQWHHSGLWDVDERPAPAAPLRRVLCADYAAALRAWQPRMEPPAATQRSAPRPLLVVFSHLRWGFIHHRPQQLMTRLAQHFQICFVEEPLTLGGPGEPRLDCVPHGPGIDVLTLRTAADDPTFSDAQVALLRPRLDAFLRARGARELVAWFYTPMALPLLDGLGARRVVYDCIDEMTAFANSPASLQARETTLLQVADLVLTSGPALYAAKRRWTPNVRCVPNGVHAAHFAPETLDFGAAQAREAERLQGSARAPRLGYCGVVDERFDLAQIETMALAHPDWHFVMAGPVIKVDPARVPRLPNILWLGHQPYARLPYLIAGWDVCLMPFLDNRITRFVNPTKVLEYMAADKPVVSTPVPDMVTLYTGTLRIAASGAAFMAACQQALNESPAGRAGRSASMREIVRRSSWESRVATVLELLAETPAKQPALDACI